MSPVSDDLRRIVNVFMGQKSCSYSKPHAVSVVSNCCDIQYSAKWLTAFSYLQSCLHTCSSWILGSLRPCLCC